MVAIYLHVCFSEALSVQVFQPYWQAAASVTH